MESILNSTVQWYSRMNNIVLILLYHRISASWWSHMIFLVLAISFETDFSRYVHFSVWFCPVLWMHVHNSWYLFGFLEKRLSLNLQNELLTSKYYLKCTGIYLLLLWYSLDTITGKALTCYKAGTYPESLRGNCWLKPSGGYRRSRSSCLSNVSVDSVITSLDSNSVKMQTLLIIAVVFGNENKIVNCWLAVRSILVVDTEWPPLQTVGQFPQIHLWRLI